MFRRAFAATAGCALTAWAAAAVAAPAPAPPPGTDAATGAWWATTAALSGDDMEGRDTGSAAYARAATYVAARFKAARLRPAGDGGSWLQTVPLSEVRVESAGTAFEVVGPDDRRLALRFPHDISVCPTDARRPRWTRR